MTALETSLTEPATRAFPSHDDVPGLPGVAVAGRPAAPRPERLLTTGTLLLADVRPGHRMALPEHRGHWGRQPLHHLGDLAGLARNAQLVGAGGAAFPTDRKLLSLEGRRVTTVVVNGSEGEATSGKDGVLLGHVPHLVLDGAMAAAHALGAASVAVRLADDRPWLRSHVARALAERDDDVSFELSVGPSSFVSGEATAVIRSLAGGPAAPAALGLPPRQPRRLLHRSGHVFLSNAETFARLAVAARGITRTSALVTASGAVAFPGVVELPAGATLATLAASVRLLGSPRLVITGGWHGAWVSWPGAASAPLTRDGITHAGGRWGAGAFVWLPEDMTPGAALAAIVGQLAEQSAGQCGPCVSGLPELAAALGRPWGAPAGTAEIRRLLAAVDGRGLCAHPSATAAAVRSALTAIGDLDEH